MIHRYEGSRRSGHDGRHAQVAMRIVNVHLSDRKGSELNQFPLPRALSDRAYVGRSARICASSGPGIKRQRGLMPVLIFHGVNSANFHSSQ